MPAAENLINGMDILEEDDSFPDILCMFSWLALRYEHEGYRKKCLEMFKDWLSWFRCLATDFVHIPEAERRRSIQLNIQGFLHELNTMIRIIELDVFYAVDSLDKKISKEEALSKVSTLFVNGLQFVHQFSTLYSQIKRPIPTSNKSPWYPIVPVTDEAEIDEIINRCKDDAFEWSCLLFDGIEHKAQAHFDSGALRYFHDLVAKIDYEQKKARKDEPAIEYNKTELREIAISYEKLWWKVAKSYNGYDIHDHVCDTLAAPSGSFLLRLISDSWNFISSLIWRDFDSEKAEYEKFVRRFLYFNWTLLGLIGNVADDVLEPKLIDSYRSYLIV